jgi:hypothetical protein
LNFTGETAPFEEEWAVYVDSVCLDDPVKGGVKEVYASGLCGTEVDFTLDSAMLEVQGHENAAILEVELVQQGDV